MIYKIKSKVVAMVTGAAALVGAGVASATEPSSAAVTAMADMQAEATSIIGAAWPFAVVVVTAAIGLKLFKKFSSKAS